MSFYFDNATFFKNNEYTGKIADGYTLTGAWIRPKLSYYPDNRLRIELGGNVLKYNGSENYHNLLPWFNVHYQPTQNLSIILGNLDNDRNHELIEPLADPERYLTSKPETGLQVKYHRSRFKADAWVDWQQFIQTGDSSQEHFAFGTLASFKLIDKKETQLWIPFTFSGQHRGGEINISTEPAHTFMAITPGLSLRKNLTSHNLKSWELNASYSLCTFPQDKTFYNKLSGWGVYANGSLDSRFGGLMLAYWRGHDFYTPQGSIIYQNLSQTGNGLIPENELINLKYHFDKEIFPASHLGLMFDLYYDTINRVYMNSEGVYLVINFGLPLAKVNKGL